MPTKIVGGGTSPPPQELIIPSLGSGRLDLALGDELLDLVRLLGVLGPLRLRQSLAGVAVAATAALHVEDLVEATLEPARVGLEGLDRLVDGDVDLLRRAGQDVLAEERLVGVDADAPDLLLLARLCTAEA